jgi:RNA polymerase sigma-70 factor (ECF subfamily)
MDHSPDLMIPTRHSLLKRLKSCDDHESWQDFFNTYWKLIYTVAIKTGLTDTESQDVVQETVIAVAKHMPAFHYNPDHGTFKSWLLHTTRWKVTDQFRKRIPSAHDLEHPGSSADTSTSPLDLVPDPKSIIHESLWNQEWKQNLFETALARVKQIVDGKQYQMFDLYAVKNWPVKKVAATLAVHPARVYLAKHRVSALIRKEIKRLEHRKVPP